MWSFLKSLFVGVNEAEIRKAQEEHFAVHGRYLPVDERRYRVDVWEAPGDVRRGPTKHGYSIKLK